MEVLIQEVNKFRSPNFCIQHSLATFLDREKQFPSPHFKSNNDKPNQENRTLEGGGCEYKQNNLKTQVRQECQQNW